MSVAAGVGLRQRMAFAGFTLDDGCAVVFPEDAFLETVAIAFVP